MSGRDRSNKPQRIIRRRERDCFLARYRAAFVAERGPAKERSGSMPFDRLLRLL